MLATFAFDVCHEVYCAAREVIDTKIPTLNLETSGKYTWHPDRLPRLLEFVADFARSGERALGAGCRDGVRGKDCFGRSVQGKCGGGFNGKLKGMQANACATGGSRMVMFRVYYLGGAEYEAARRHLGISEATWADWAEEIRKVVGQELTRAGVFPPSKYFRESSARVS